MKTLVLASISKTSLRSATIALMFAILSGALAAQSVQAQTYTVLYTFMGVADGAVPEAGLVRDPEGNLYGTTLAGGDFTCNPLGCGVVFKIDTTGKETLLYSFRRGNGYGSIELAGLTLDSQGNLFGTRVAPDIGIAFELTPSDRFAVLHNFHRAAGGLYPEARVVLDSSGNLYGTTATGGNSTASGVVFKLDKFGRETVLYTFTCPICNGKKGGGFGYPTGGVIRDSGGNLFGTASGGTKTKYCSSGCGVVYKIDKTGVGSVLYNFKWGTDGMIPGGNLIMDAAGNLYGTTRMGGNSGCFENYGCGIVFKVDPSGKETVLYRFSGGKDGGIPTGGLALDSQGNLYGTTSIGGANGCFMTYSGCGTIFKVAPGGALTILYTFMGGTDGGYPNPDLVKDDAGNLYGTAGAGGGTSCPDYVSCGVVFKITP
ncbi:MAG TPA: choice-of-anchor tandem repeat GloVer-containing protein [Terriglobales bacterium]|nr:choice-of-anchor tandem repeat GloVer-containing protein [Terriglobales bacterium]